MSNHPFGKFVLRYGFILLGWTAADLVMDKPLFSPSALGVAFLIACVFEALDR